MSFFQLDPPPINCIVTLVKPFSFVCYVILLLKTGVLASTRDHFLWFDDENIKKIRRSHVRFILLDIILARWWRPVASSKALHLLHRAMRVVLYRCTATAINMATFLGVVIDWCLFACCSGSRWGDTERVFAQWRCRVTSEVALDMPHWAMPSVLLWRIRKAFETGCNGGAFSCHCWFCHWP
jgi:hypothetical protein